MRICTFDTEIAIAIDDKNREEEFAKARRGEKGLSALVVWDNQTGRPHTYDAKSIQRGIDHLESADLLVSYNGVRFDLPLLIGVSGRYIVVQNHYDILLNIWSSQRHGERFQKGNKLGEVCKRTLDKSKMNGAGAPILANEGRWGELFDYCINDVALTRELYNHVVQNGWVIDVNGERLYLDQPVEELA